MAVLVVHAFDALYNLMTGRDDPPIDPRLRVLELLRRPDWHAQAACRGQGVDSYFGTSATDGAGSACSRCAVRLESATYALADPDCVGRWAGTDLAQRIEARARGMDAAALLAALDADEPVADPARVTCSRCGVPKPRKQTTGGICNPCRHARARELQARTAARKSRRAGRY